jgi:hypothetical protein
MFNAAVINLITGVQEAGQTVNYQSLDEGIGAMEELSVALGGGIAPVWTASGSKEWKVAGEASFKLALAAINAAKDGEYTITLTGSFQSDPVSFSNGAAKTITLRGEGRERIISSKADKPLFTVPGTITLVLDNNLTLNGNNKKTALGLVQIEGGALIMKAGSTLRSSVARGVHIDKSGRFTMNGGTISGNSTSGGGGGGVYVSYNGIFTMNGGTISGNSTSISGGGVASFGSFTMNGGTISGNSASMFGGGVIVISGSFTMSGGTISGNSANSDGGGVYVNGGRFVKTGGTIDATNTAREGKVVYVIGSGRKRNSAAGPGVKLDSSVSGRAGGWE